MRHKLVPLLTGTFLLAGALASCAGEPVIPATPTPVATSTATNTPSPAPTATPTEAPSPSPTVVPAAPAIRPPTSIGQSGPPSAGEKVAPRPAGAGRGLPYKRTLLCYYGNRAAKTMGILGEFPLEQIAQRLRDLGGAYSALNGNRGTMPCLDYVYLVANDSAFPYSHYTPRMDLFEEALEFAEGRGLLFFIDLQLGYRDIGEEIAKVLPYLLKSNVHLAIDTEFYMHRRGGVPGDTLGSMDAADINRIQELMQRFIGEHHLPDKILKVYQFDPIMLTNKDQLTVDTPNVHLLINADGVGYGGSAGKVNDYAEYAAERHNALGIKLFIDWDTPLLLPAEVMKLDPPPDEIVYQ